MTSSSQGVYTWDSAHWQRTNEAPYGHQSRDRVAAFAQVYCNNSLQDRKPVTCQKRRAAERRNRSSRVKGARGRPTRTEQQWASRLVTKAWTKIAAASWDKNRETASS